MKNKEDKTATLGCFLLAVVILVIFARYFTMLVKDLL